MAGKFNKIDEKHDYFSSTTHETSNVPHRHDGSNINMDRSSGRTNDIDPMTTNTIAAIVSALLATTFLILVVFIIRVIRKRRQQRQRNRFGAPVIHTITPSNFGVNVDASSSSDVPIAGRMSWENVATSSAPVLNSEPV